MVPGSEDVITAEGAGTLDGLFRERVRRSPDHVAYRSFDRVTGKWVDWSWADMARQVHVWRAALATERLHPGDRVAIYMRNRPQWIAFEQAALASGLVVVPLYVDDRPDNVAYILGDAAVKLLLVGDLGQWHRLRDALAEVSCLQRVVVLEPGHHRRAGSEDDARVSAADAWLAAAAAAQPPEPRVGDPQALATIVYTSGTTGRPKGVMLSHYNILSIAHAAIVSYDVYLEDVFLSFLPLSHTFERTVGYYVPMMAGSTVAYARSIQQLADDLQTIRPTALIAVPRVFERVHGRIQEQLAAKGRAARQLFRLTVSVGWRRFQVAQGRARWRPSLLLWPMLDRLVARPVRDRFGGRTRIIVSGGAPLPPAVARTFVGLGLNIVQGYGMTETSPVVSGNPLDDNIPASVGVPLHGVEVRIGDNDELLVRGCGVMLGYWNNHAATAATIDADGWLRTGDQARIENGHIFITGRLKDIVVLSNGEKVPPTDVEEALNLDPLFDQVMVVGEGQAYLAAVVALNADAWVKLAPELGVDPFNREGVDDEHLQRKLLSRIRALMHEFPGYAKIRRVHATLEPWTIDNGLLTPTLKVRRNEVMKRYAREIEALYA
ncbi:MAG: long-chain fatty acid--CoA ligase [Gammaproteobacteria bacterium]